MKKIVSMLLVLALLMPIIAVAEDSIYSITVTSSGEMDFSGLDGMTIEEITFLRTYCDTQIEESTAASSGANAATGEVTTGMKNALRSAQNYLDFMAFSYEGLVKQLKYEQYSEEEAVYAADNCGADWNEQAAKAAETYLDFMSFSRDGLIDQLAYDGFTNEQAKYGVKQNGF